MKVLFTGGGTLGPVTPLLAVAEVFIAEHEGTEFAWVGTKTGPEFTLVDEAGIPFFAISSGKLRRYFSLKNFTDMFRIAAGFFQSVVLLRRLRPDVVVSAGGFVAVPVIWAAGLLRMRVHIHQQDIRPGLANKLCLPFATTVSVAFERSLEDYAKYAPVWTGNPVREAVLSGDAQTARQLFGLEEGVPTVLFLGGGTGAASLNALILELASEITEFAQIVHVTGKGKTLSPASDIPRYHPVEFLTDTMKHAYAGADLVVTRAGMGTLSELAALGKPTIIVPMPQSHQEDNARLFADHGGVPVYKETDDESDRSLVQMVRGILEDTTRHKVVSEGLRGMMPQHPAERIMKIISGT